MEQSDNEPASGKSVATAACRPIDDPRVYLAAERTFLAWVRTSIALMGFGFLIARFAFLIRMYEGNNARPVHTRPQFSSLLGFGMVCVGVLVCMIAAFRHRAYVGELQEGVANPTLNVKATLILAGTLAAVGLAIAIHVLTL